MRFLFGTPFVTNFGKLPCILTFTLFQLYIGIVSVCLLSICLFVLLIYNCLSVQFLFVCLFSQISFNLSIFLLVLPCVCLSISSSVHLSICTTICLSVRVTFLSSVHLSVYFFFFFIGTILSYIRTPRRALNAPHLPPREGVQTRHLSVCVTL